MTIEHVGAETPKLIVSPEERRHPGKTSQICGAEKSRENDVLGLRRLAWPAVTFGEVDDAGEPALARELLKAHAHHRLVAEASGS
jgi:hypothetical protein